MSGTKLNKKLIIQSFIGELDAQSQRELTEWMSADPANADRYNKWKLKWEKGEITAQWENIDLEKNWGQIIQKSETGKKSGIRYLDILKYAAAAAILIFIGFWWLSQNTLTELSNEEKITQSFVLPDETEIWLKPGSSIRFDEVGFLDDRSVSLLGEGYFEVRKGQIPFVVTTGDAAIEVLGTAFNVKSKDRTADVALIEGSIKFYSKDQEMILSPGEQVMFDGSQIRKVSQSFNENEIGWKTGIFRFSDTPITEVARLISPYYGVDIVVAPEKKNLILTATFDRLSLELLIQELNYILDLDIVQEGEKLILK